MLGSSKGKLAARKVGRSRLCAEALVKHGQVKEMREPLHLNAVPKSLCAIDGTLKPSVWKRASCKGTLGWGQAGKAAARP